MIIIKWLILLMILLTSSALGIMLANKYKARVQELKEMRVALDMLKTKMQYTYQPLPQIFLEISKKFEGEVGKIFKIASINMNKMSAGEAWRYTLENSNTSMKKEDIDILKNLEKLLGITNLEGQISEIEVIENFIEEQIIVAEGEQKKNEKLYKNLGIIVGLAIAIILV